jgi:hypothetical protein
MHALELPEILEIWERGQAMHPVDRALALLARSRLAATRDELAALTLGERDMLLLRLRRRGTRHRALPVLRRAARVHAGLSRPHCPSGVRVRAGPVPGGRGRIRGAGASREHV